MHSSPGQPPFLKDDAESEGDAGSDSELERRIVKRRWDKVCTAVSSIPSVFPDGTTQEQRQRRRMEDREKSDSEDWDSTSSDVDYGSLWIGDSDEESATV